MNKILLIIQREYITRVKNKTFMLITLLAPLLYGLLIMIPVITQKYGTSVKTVAVVDESGKFNDIVSNDESLKMYNTGQSLAEVEKSFKADDNDFYILHIPAGFDIFKPKGIELRSEE